MHEREWAEFGRIRAPGRAEEWLAARVAVKILARDVLKLGNPRGWRVEKTSRGVPRLVLERPVGSSVLPCSLSHSRGLALAALSADDGWDLGVDIQRLSPKLPDLRHCFADPDDRLGQALPDLWASTFLWACKEAASKALGLGMALDFRFIRITGDKAGRFRARCPGFGRVEGRFFPLAPDWAAAVCYHARA